jgi:DNA-binding transcriptional MocR family regulator
MALKNIRLDRKSRFPLYRQIKDQIKDMILEDLLPGGNRLPPTRELAQTLRVNRSTVVSAYNELIAEGLIGSHVGRGTVVSKKEPGNELVYEDQPLNWSEFFAAAPKVETLSFYEAFVSPPAQEDFISLGIGVPDPEHYPFLDLKNTIDKVLEEKWRLILQLMLPEGYYPLREVLAEWSVPEGQPISPEEVLISAGAVQAVHLICKLLLVPGDMVVVENPTSTNGLMAFRAAQAKIVDIPIDNQGMRVDILENLLARQKVKLIYTIPTYQNPSGTVLSLERRLKLLDLAQRFRIPIIEEDPYSKLYYDKIPPPALKSLDKYSSVIYVGTFSKILFQGLRVGWVAAAKPVIKQLSSIKYLIDLHTSSLEQYALNEFIRKGLLEKHLQKMRKIYTRKRDLMISALSKYCSDSFSWNTPAGGICLWCQLSGGLKALDLLKEAVYEKVIFIDGKTFAPQGNNDEWLRLNFTYLSESQIEEGIRRLSRAVQRLKKRLRKKSGKESVSLKPIF